jgi:hypothetical protein
LELISVKYQVGVKKFHLLGTYCKGVERELAAYKSTFNEALGFELITLI